jgi:hypothetical protein
MKKLFIALSILLCSTQNAFASNFDDLTKILEIKKLINLNAQNAFIHNHLNQIESDIKDEWSNWGYTNFTSIKAMSELYTIRINRNCFDNMKISNAKKLAGALKGQIKEVLYFFKNYHLLTFGNKISTFNILTVELCSNKSRSNTWDGLRTRGFLLDNSEGVIAYELNTLYINNKLFESWGSTGYYFINADEIKHQWDHGKFFTNEDDFLNSPVKWALMNPLGYFRGQLRSFLYTKSEKLIDKINLFQKDTSQLSQEEQTEEAIRFVNNNTNSDHFEFNLKTTFESNNIIDVSKFFSRWKNVLKNEDFLSEIAEARTHAVLAKRKNVNEKLRQVSGLFNFSNHKIITVNVDLVKKYSPYVSDSVEVIKETRDYDVFQFSYGANFRLIDDIDITARAEFSPGSFEAASFAKTLKLGPTQAGLQF